MTSNFTIDKEISLYFHSTQECFIIIQIVHCFVICNRTLVSLLCSVKRYPFGKVYGGVKTVPKWNTQLLNNTTLYHRMML